MCAGCVMAAMAGASGTRSWLQAHHITPRRLRAMTIAMFVAAFGVSSVGISGSAAAPHAQGASTPHAHAVSSPAATR